MKEEFRDIKDYEGLYQVSNFGRVKSLERMTWNGKGWYHRKEIILKLPQNGSMIALLTGGQSAMPQIIEMLSNKLEFEDVTGYGFVKRWYPRGVQGLIVIDPEISFGRPTLKGRAVPTHNIYDLYLGEKKKIAPVSNWFRIPAPEIDAAIKFEQQLWA